ATRSDLPMDERGPDPLGRERVRHPVNALRRADHENTAGVEGLVKALTEAAAGVLVEVDQEIPAQDQVERPQVGERLHEVQPEELDPAAERLVDDPAAVYVPEVSRPVLGGAPPADLGGGIPPLPRDYERALGDVGRQDREVVQGQADAWAAC